jgi:hypothetical protein
MMNEDVNVAKGTAMPAVSHPQPVSKPWWRYPLVWLVVGLPAAVVVASLGSAWLAVHRPDPVIDEDYYQKGQDINRTLDAKTHVPAETGRNHAMTPSDDLPLARPPKP